MSNVWDDGKVQQALVDIALVGGLDLVGLLLCSDRGYDRVAMVEEDVESVGSDEAAASSKKYSCHCDVVLSVRKGISNREA